MAARCRKASRAAKRAASATAGREGPPPEAVAIAPEEARLTDEQWVLLRPLLGTSVNKGKKKG